MSFDARISPACFVWIGRAQHGYAVTIMVRFELAAYGHVPLLSCLRLRIYRRHWDD